MTDNSESYFFSGQHCELKLLATIAEHPSEINASTPYGLTPLMAAIQKGTPNEVSLLLANGAVADDKHFNYARRYFNRPEIIATMNAAVMRAEIEKAIANSSVEEEANSSPTRPARRSGL